MFDRFRSKAQWLSLPAVLLFAGFATPLHASQDRIRASVAASSLTELPQNVAPRARAAADLGAADPKLVLDNITLSFSITDAQQAALTELLLEQQQPASANYHKWLTPEQFADQFGLSTTDLAKVTTWLTSQGFTVTSVPRSRNFVSFSGTAAQVQQAFGTTIHNLSLDGEKHFANLTNPSVPSALAGVVGSISGLHDFKLVSRAKSRVVPAADAVRPQFTSNLSGNIYFAPSDFYTVYDVNPLLSNSINGSGIKIAVMGQTDISLSDAAAFRTAAGLSANPPTIQLYGNDPGTPSTNDLTEAMLDVEWSGAIAPSASIIYVNSKNVIDISLRQAIANNLAPIITISYGNCESGYGDAATLASFNLAFQQANAQGITIVGPSGDSGAADCDYQATTATQGLAVDFPASSPYVTGVGGTQFNEGSGSYWATVNSSTYNNTESALSYIPEAVWNESTSSGISAGGGGSSAYFTKPAWQVGTGVPADFARDVPDVALDAALNHDGILMCAQGSCVNGFRNANGNLLTVGGTSAATPSFAGLLALVLQKNGPSATNATKGLGNVNPTLYALANSTYYTSVFHDVTTGNNAVSCTSGTTNCPAGTTSIGYSAGVGYDLASGWGSVDAYNLVNDWKLVTPIGTGTGVGQVLSTTTVTTSTPNVTQGTAIPFTATVASGNTSTSGAPSSSATPTGTVQLFVDGTASGSTVALVSGSATLTLATTSITPGTHTVSVAYSGDATYAGSKGSVGIDVTSLSSADFSIAASATTITVKSGSAAPTVTYTLKSLNNLAGTVTMSASAATSLTASATFTPSTVTLTAGSSGTSVFSLYAYVTNGSSSPALPLASNRKPTWMVASGGMAFASMLLILIPGRKRRKLSRNAGLFCVLLLSVVALGLSGCGGSSGLASVAGTQTNTTPGTYPITITATSGSITHTTTLTLVVQ